MSLGFMVANGKMMVLFISKLEEMCVLRTTTMSRVMFCHSSKTNTEDSYVLIQDGAHSQKSASSAKLISAPPPVWS